MNKFVKKTRLFIFSLLFFFLVSLQVAAEGLEIDWPDSPMNTSLEMGSGVAELVKYLYEWGIAIGIIIFFGVLIFAGFEFITSAGYPDRRNSAKKRVVSGFAGVLLLLGSFLLLNTINPELTTIREVELREEGAGFHEFQSGMVDDEKMCEFAFITVQEDDIDTRTTHFAIPGMAIKTEEVLPMHSYACVPERNENQVLEVRRNEDEGYYKLVRRQTGREVSQDDFSNYERVYYRDQDSGEEFDLEDDYQDDLNQLYAMRYEHMGDINIDVDTQEQRDLFAFWLSARERGLYNTFAPGICSDGLEGDDDVGMIENPDFERIRCLELDIEEGGDGSITGVTVEEWRKRGYASLNKAWEAIGEKTSEELDEDSTCPTAEEMGAEDGSRLGYRRDSTGGGCPLAFYDGTEVEYRYVFFGREEVPICEKQISRPAADMDHFDAIVDRESNCMELIRHEPALGVDPSSYTHRVTLDRSVAGSGEGIIYFCRGGVRDNCKEGSSSLMRTLRDPDQEDSFNVVPDRYTISIAPAGYRHPDGNFWHYEFAYPEECEGKTECVGRIRRDMEFIIREKVN